MSFPAVRRELLLDASAHAAYRAWLTPGTLLKWMNPGTIECVRAEVDERVGGRYRIWQSQDGVPGGGFEAEILELDKDRRIAFRWGFVGPDREAGPGQEAGPIYDSLLTVTFDELPDGRTRLVLLHENLDALADAMPGVAPMVDAGWADVLEKLAQALNQGA